MRLLTALASALLAAAGLHAVPACAQDVGAWMPRNAGTALAVPPVSIERKLFGSGQPHAPGYENAVLVVNDVYHAPQYLPGYPTSATIWPRVVVIQCANELCSGYEVTPELGRGEYLFFRPARK